MMKTAFPVFSGTIFGVGIGYYIVHGDPAVMIAGAILTAAAIIVVAVAR